MMPRQNTGLHRHAIDLLRKTITAHEAVRQGIATHAQKNHARRQGELNRMHQQAELSKPLGSPHEIV